MRNWKLAPLVVCILLFIALPVLVSAKPTRVKFLTRFVEVPNSYSTSITGINDLGQYVGVYGLSDSVSQAFLYSNSKYTTLHVRDNAITTVPNCINNHGDIVGFTIDPEGNSQNFIMRDGKISTVVLPGLRTTQCEVSGINDSGVIVGDYEDSHGITQGYKICKGVLTIIKLPQPMHIYHVAGINDKDDIIGTCIVKGYSQSHGFLIHNGKCIFINMLNSDITLLTGINNLGEIVGLANVGLPGSQRSTAFLLESITFSSPHLIAKYSHIEFAAINNRNQIVGSAFLTKTNLTKGALLTFVNTTPVHHVRQHN
jgi:hypothetical protein